MQFFSEVCEYRSREPVEKQLAGQQLECVNMPSEHAFVRGFIPTVANIVITVNSHTHTHTRTHTQSGKD